MLTSMHCQTRPDSRLSLIPVLRGNKVRIACRVCEYNCEGDDHLIQQRLIVTAFCIGFESVERSKRESRRGPKTQSPYHSIHILPCKPQRREECLHRAVRILLASDLTA